MKQVNQEESKKVPRRRFRALEKRTIITQTYQLENSVSSVARKYDIAPSQLYQWRKAMESGGLTGIGSEEGVVSAKELKKLKHRIKELEAALGRKTMDVEILKEAVKVGREKKLISQKPLLGLDDFE